MKTLANIFLGFFIFEGIVAAPTIDTLTYDSDLYGIILGESDNLFDHIENEQSAQAEVI